MPFSSKPPLLFRAWTNVPRMNYLGAEPSIVHWTINSLQERGILVCPIQITSIDLDTFVYILFLAFSRNFWFATAITLHCDIYIFLLSLNSSHSIKIKWLCMGTKKELTIIISSKYVINYLLLSFNNFNNKSSIRTVSSFSLINLFLNSTNPFIIIPNSAWSNFNFIFLHLPAPYYQIHLGGTYQLG